MGWFTEYSAAAATTDKFAKKPQHRRLLTLGLLSESGSVVAELKKKVRESRAYPAYQHRLSEEIGDMLWYFACLAATVEPKSASSYDHRPVRVETQCAPLLAALALGRHVGDLVAALEDNPSKLGDRLATVWSALVVVCSVGDVDLKQAADDNLLKIASRWPSRAVYLPLFDEKCEMVERFPRRLKVEFREVVPGDHGVTLLRCNGLNFGDRLTDNSRSPDYYRYHDIFHFAYAVHLGWSPVTRGLFSCKRKSDPKADEVQDGARALILEEAASAVIFARAKELDYFAGRRGVDFDLLKLVHELVRGYEAEDAPLWQWEVAILEGFRVFRSLRRNHGGIVTIDFNKRTLRYRKPAW